MNLFLAPHHDDETLFGSFLLLRYQPLVVVCFRSYVQEIYGITSEQREAETDAAMGVLGCKWHQWPLPDDGSVADEDLEAFMWGLWDPAGDDGFEIVFAPAVEYKGAPQHNLVGEVAKRVFGDAVSYYLTYTLPPLKRSRSRHEISYEPEWLFLKHAALSCYRSQAATPSFRHFSEDMAEYFA